MEEMSLQEEIGRQRKRRKESSKIMELKLMMPNAASNELHVDAS